MSGPFDYWELLAGIGLFLFAMQQLEAALQLLAGRSLAGFLRRATGNRFRAVGAGLLATALLQSSSIVALMVLAFVGAGLLALPAALGVVVGSNLGTTLTGWAVATVGFKVDIDAAALPLIGGGALLLLWGRGRWMALGQLGFAMGLLLLGLDLMKSSTGALTEIIDTRTLAGLALWQYACFGIVVAGVIQSSSATMMITLAALNADLIALPGAAAIAIGADLGTTTTVVLGAARGSAYKRQVAAGHVVFNLTTDALAFVALAPLLALVAAMGITDPLYSLVAFHSLFNLFGLLLFVPLLNPFAAWLARKFPAADMHETRYLTEVRPGVAAVALEAVEKESARAIARALRCQMLAFEPPLPPPPGLPPVADDEPAGPRAKQDFAKLYEASKVLEGEILEFTIRLQAETAETAVTARLNALRSAVRRSLHAAKAIKDIRHNLVEMAASPDPQVSRHTERCRQAMQRFVADLFALRPEPATVPGIESLAPVLQSVYADYEAFNAEIYADVRDSVVGERQVSSLLNVARELLRTRESLVFALAHYYLSPADAQVLERLSLGSAHVALGGAAST
ncbi:MAG: Na/Pi symporter [Gammaproteobacteria bacterium]|jgi:phosphate:Na+ symporter|nr:Na/Pi symporter [Gammaproteobacteria bacterium]